MTGSKHKDPRMNKARPLCSMDSQGDRHVNKATVAAACPGEEPDKK